LTALTARVAALEASMIWNLNSAAAGSAAGPTTSATISSLSTTKRSYVRFKWTQTGAALTVPGMEFEPASVAGDGESGSVRITGAGGFSDDTAKAVAIAGVNVLNSINELDIYIDPVTKTGWTFHNSGLTGNASRGGIALLAWNQSSISSFRLNMLTASATMTSVTWKVWTET
jgi:hypothetical protein